MLIAKENGQKIELRFKKFLSSNEFSHYVGQIKTINGKAFVKTASEGYWTIPLSEKAALETMFKGKELEWVSTPAPVIKHTKKISEDLSYIDELLLPPYPFQAIGINYLCDQKKCLLSDEMGLGKSLQAIGATYKLFRQGKVKKALIVCPSSLKYQWAEEIDKFIDRNIYGIEYKVIDGTPSKRVESYDYIEKNNVLYTLINYELIINDIEYLLEQDWDIVVLDEAHRIKNWASKTSESIMKLNKAQYKWAATGTPVQNKPDEVYNIFRFIDESILGSWWKFRGKYIIIGTKFRQPNMVLGFKNLSQLHGILSPYMLRRLKKDVAPELPKMLINNYYVEMYKEQATLHERIRDEIIEIIKEVSKHTERDENGTIISQHPKANQTLGMFTMLQEVCDTPELLSMSESNMAKRYSINKNKSPKLDELVNILKDFLASYDVENVADKYKNLGPKAVIFTQFARMQDLIVDRISKLGDCKVINGSMSAVEKQGAAVEFKMNGDIRFLVCTDAANYGLNLGEASLLINVDLPWNPATLAQRNARIHRIDSEHESVNIINLISKDSLDERILEAIFTKEELASEIIENREAENQYLSGLTNTMMKKLLKKKKTKGGKD